jgi:hypothetical protein
MISFSGGEVPEPSNLVIGSLLGWEYAQTIGRISGAEWSIDA